MPISPIILQRRHAELGRIRLGQKVESGNGKSRPQKLERFRFTSPGQQYIYDLAELYGGEAKSWDNGGKPEFEVLSEATSMPVIVVKGGLSQWMETWSGGGIAHRCDGEVSVDGTRCDPDEYIEVGRDKKRIYVHREAKPTTRLSVMLPELEAVGVWRMESHGWNAAAEIPAVAELAQFVGDLVPAVLHLVERRTVKDGQTSRFVVPVLDLQIGTRQLQEIVAAKSGTVAALQGGAPERPAIESGQQGPAIEQGPAVSRVPHHEDTATPDYLGEAKAATTLDQVRDIWNRAEAAGHLDDELKAALKPIGDALATKTAGAGDGETPAPAAAAELDPDAVWQQILTVAGSMDPPMSTPDVSDGFAEFAGGVTAETASAAELQAYLDHLRGQA